MNQFNDDNKLKHPGFQQEEIDEYTLSDALDFLFVLTLSILGLIGVLFGVYVYIMN